MSPGSWVDLRPETKVAESEYARLLGFPLHRRLEGRALELAESALAWYAAHGRPWIWVAPCPKVRWDADVVELGGARFHSARLRQQLQEAEAHEAALVAVSAGPECEARAAEFWREEKPDEYFFMETCGSAVVEHLVMAAGARLCAQAESEGMAVLPHYSPGYTGWDVSDQTELLQLFARSGGAFPGPLSVLDSGMLVPKKSLLAVFGITRHRERVKGSLVPCENCGLPKCQFRRAPYRFAPLPAEPAMPNAQRDSNKMYRTSIRALRKWSGERLKLEFEEGGAVTARFRFEGTTCSNLGHALLFDYAVTLQGVNGGYRILGATCTPAAEDTGHRKMCSYLDRGEPFMAEVRDDLLLAGRMLDDVLNWERAYSPSGCFCSEPSRLHKWGLVLETVHYALVQGRNSGNQHA